MSEQFKEAVYNQAVQAKLTNPVVFVEIVKSMIDDYRDGYHDHDSFDPIAERKKLEAFAKATEALAEASSALRPEIWQLMVRGLPRRSFLLSDIDDRQHRFNNRKGFIRKLKLVSKRSQRQAEVFKNAKGHKHKNVERDRLLFRLVLNFMQYERTGRLPPVWGDEASENISPFLAIVNLVMKEIKLQPMGRTSLIRFLKGRFSTI